MNRLHDAGGCEIVCCMIYDLGHKDLGLADNHQANICGCKVLFGAI